MGVIGIYDYDFQNYSHVVPNLECAKLCAYYANHRQIVTLTPIIDTQRYSKIILRKDYDDNKFIPSLKKDNVEYGGYAFSKDVYVPLDEAIESTIPNVGVYSKYRENFGVKDQDQYTFSILLNAHHCRLSLDGKTVWNKYYKQLNITDSKRHTIFLHDQNIQNIQGATDVIKEIVTSNLTINQAPRSIGMKFPIKINNEKMFQQWLAISANFHTFFMEYNGIMSNEMMHELITTNRSIATTFLYSPCEPWISEDDFYDNKLMPLFLHIIYCRNNGVKCHVKCDWNSLFIPSIVKNLLRLFNSYAQCDNTDLNSNHSLFLFSKSYISHPRWFQYLSKNQIMEVFQTVRLRNYDVFDLFYRCDRVIYKGGNFINDTPTNKRKNR